MFEREVHERQEIATIPYYLHRGFWAPINVDMVGDYHPIVAHKMELSVVGRRLPGVLIHLEPDLEWTLTAYDFTP